MPSEGAIPSWYSLWQRGCLVVITSGFYLQKILFPLRLCYYSNLAVPDSWQAVVQSSFFWTGIGGIVSFAMSLKYAPRLSFALGWIGITLLPVLNIILIPTLAKENFLYIPSIGFSLFLCLLMPSLAKEAQDSHRNILRVSITASILLGILYSGATFQRNTAYREPVTFLENTLKNMTPVPHHLREDICFFEGVKNFYITYKNLGILYQERGQWDAAVQAFENALQFTPSYFSPLYKATVRVSLGGVYEKTGRLDDASAVLLEARPDAPKPSVVDNLLGIIASKQGEKQRAEFYFKRAIRNDERYAPAYYNLEVLSRQANAHQKTQNPL
jgi:tetratricopeptide (TPR) repeat protein